MQANLHHVGLYMSSIKEWSDASAGDAAAAVGIALRMKIPDEIGLPAQEVEGRI